MNELEEDEKEIDHLPVLEVACEDCHGRGHSLCGHWDRCASCDGRGYIPTPAGVRILSLIAHNTAGFRETGK